MNQSRVISTAVLFLLLGTAIPAFAQKGEEEKGGGGGKAQQAQHQEQTQHAQQKRSSQQHAQQAQHQEQSSAPQRAQHQEKSQRAKRRSTRRNRSAPSRLSAREQSQRAQRRTSGGQAAGNNRCANGGGGHYGRISNASYRDHFGQGHSFHMGHPQMKGGYNRFQYGGYSFGYDQGWPEGWGYNDDLYVVYIDGAYYLCDLRFPGIQLTLDIF